MQLAINISDDNLDEVALAFGYQPNPCNPDLPTAGAFVQTATTDYVKQVLANYRARMAAAAEMTKPIEL